LVCLLPSFEEAIDNLVGLSTEKVAVDMRLAAVAWCDAGEAASSWWEGMSEGV
jgi:hypothetical protein